MNAENMQVLVNTIGAVESGGQVYGKRDYAAYTPPYTGSQEEHTITLGWAQNYGAEARELVQMIFDADPEGSAKIDSKGSVKAMLGKDWEATRWKPTAAQKKVLVALITSDAGKECQDKLFAKLMAGFIADCAAKYTDDVRAQMMYCEIRHLGGLGPVNRIFGRLGGDYSLDAIMASLVRDQKDTTNDNQVGDAKFWPRHLKCKEFIERYAMDEDAVAAGATPRQQEAAAGMTEDEAIQKVIGIAAGEIGYLEKASGSSLDNPTANAGSANYTKYWRDVYPEFQAQAWCACFVSWCFMKAFGLEAARKLLKHWPFVYCPTLAGMTGNKSPKVGSVILFYRDGEYAHTGIVVEVSGNKVTTIEGNTSGASGIIPNGGGVCKKSYTLGGLNASTKYFMPDYSIVTSPVTSGQASGSGSAVASSGAPSKAIKWQGLITDPTGANVRTWAGTENPQVSFSPLEYGAIVGICDTIQAADGTDWYYIRYKEKYGFLSAALVKEYSGNGSLPATPEGQQGKMTATYGAALGPDPGIAGTYLVTATELNIRNRPGTAAEGCYVLGTLPQGTAVRCYGYHTFAEGGEWLYIQVTHNGTTYTGHCSADWLERA